MALIKEGVVYEAIVTLLAGSEPYATPVGFWRLGDEVLIKLYKGSRTHSLLKTVENPVLNVTRDPFLFYRTAFKSESNGLTREDFIIDEEKRVAYLRNAEAYILLKLIGVVEYEHYGLFKYGILEAREGAVRCVEPYTRCYSSLIEMIVYATKVKAWRDLAGEELEAALRSIEDSFRVVSKTCRSRDYLVLAENIRRLVENWLRR